MGVGPNDNGSVAGESTVSQPREAYARISEARGRERAELDRRMARIEVARVSVFVLGAVAALLRGDLPVPPVLPTLLSVACGVGFIVLVVRHRALRHRRTRVVASGSLADMGMARLDRDWTALAEAFDEVGYSDPLLLPEAAREAHPYSADLDVFGPASVRCLLGPTPTPTGVEHLRRWLAQPSSPEAVRERQAAVAAVAADHEAHERLTVESLLIDPSDTAAWERFLIWTKGPSPFSPDGIPAWALVLARVAPVVTWTMFALWIPALVPGWTWMIPLGIQAGLAWRWAQKLDGYFGLAAGRSRGLRRHHTLFEAWETYESPDPLVSDRVGRLRDAHDQTASASIRSLERLLDLTESRASMLQPLLAAGLLFDVHLAWAMERWRANSGTRVEQWFDALGELEAVCALATLVHDQPEWVFPEVVDREPSFEAVALGHPLLSDAVRRPSDVTVDRPGRFLLVTGSNMSGKSTLLRSIGLAAVMAQAGSVVCARQATMSPLRVFTSMRIHDSITGGVSLFMAELLRLKQLVDAADEASPGSPALLYLVDEVLQGTNSEERRVAARRIIAHLLGAHAIGAVTTHDLALHEEEALDQASTKVHFRETVDAGGDQILTFDYVLRPGLATSRNALKLLRIVGLDDGGDAPHP